MGLPPYLAPTEQTLRCVCSKLYFVSFTGVEESRERVARLGADLIDAREVLFTYCGCGEFLDLSPEDTPMLVN